MQLINRVFNSQSFRSGCVIISGEAKGEIIGADNIVIKSSGYCISDIKAKRLEISGTVKGNIEVDNLIVRGKGKLSYGKISYKELILAKSGIMFHSIEMDSEKMDLIQPKVLTQDEIKAPAVIKKIPRICSSYRMIE